MSAVGLNFRDVLNVLGEYPGDPGPPGSDSSGRVVARGADVKHVQKHDAVMGFARAPLANMARTDGQFLAPKPGRLSFEVACTLPSVWCTVHLA